MRKERKHYTAEEKVAILRRHLLDKVPVSDLCEELGLQPTVFYRWQKISTAQRDRLCDAAGSACRTTGRDPRGSRSQVRRGS